MDKYKELLKDIATIIADAHRENFLLSSELERVKGQLEAAETKIEDIVARQAVAMMAQEDAGDA